MSTARLDPARINQEGVSFSVIVPVYNRRVQVASCIASVRSQTYRNFEIIVVDDGSTDGSCSQFADATDVKVLRKANGGPAEARNFGARQAHGDYLFFLDSDDLAFPWSLQSYAAAVAASAGDAPAIVCGNFIDFSGDDPRPVPGPLTTHAYADYFEAAQGGLYAAGGMVAIRREIFAAVAGFDASMKVAEDHDLMLRLGTTPGFVHILAPPTYAKRQHKGSISNSLRLLHLGNADLLTHLATGAYGRESRAVRVAGAMVGSHVRAAVATLARHGEAKRGFDLYRRAVPLHRDLRRFKFLLLAPLMISGARFTRLFRRRRA